MMNCVECGRETRIRKRKKVDQYVHRLRACNQNHSFYTIQNGTGSEYFDCWHRIAMATRAYPEMAYAYRSLKRGLVSIGVSEGVLHALERARIRAGVSLIQ